MIAGQAPEGSTLAYTDRYAAQVEQLLARIARDAAPISSIVGQPEVNAVLWRSAA